MKRSFILVLCMLMLLATSASLYAQQAGSFTFGGRVGGAVNHVERNALWDFVSDHFSTPAATHRVALDMSPNLNFAMYFNFTINNRFSIQPELNVMIQQGYDLILSAAGQRSIMVDVEYTSLDIPILARFNFLTSPLIFGIQAGPHISIPLGRLEVYEDNDWTVNLYESFSINTFASFGVTAGLFAGVPLGPGRIVGDLRFIVDLNSLEADIFGVSTEFISRRALAFSLGYEISF